MSVATRVRHFTRVLDVDQREFSRLLDLSGRLKEEPERYETALHGRTIACIFEKPSTRTRVSFAAAAAELGATAVSLSPQELQLGRGESLADTARSLSGYCAAIVARTYSQETIDELAAWATVPVVNALSDEHHPCQALADLLTVREQRGELPGKRLAFVGDGGDNVAHSLLEAGALAGLDVAIACPQGYEPKPEILEAAHTAAQRTGGRLTVTPDPRVAVSEADVVYADVWTSMGEEAERETRLRDLRDYQVNEALMALARPDALFLHCLPAHRGEEVTAEVIDGGQSAVWAESANRMPTEAALLLALIHGFEEVE